MSGHSMRTGRTQASWCLQREFVSPRSDGFMLRRISHPKLHVLAIVADEPPVLSPCRTLSEGAPVAKGLGADLEKSGDLPLGQKGLHGRAPPAPCGASQLRPDKATRSRFYSQAMSRAVPRQGTGDRQQASSGSASPEVHLGSGRMVLL